MYQAKHKPNQLILGSGNIAIITGWYPRETFYKKLIEYKPELFNKIGVIGNLYSPNRGISFLLRNLLINPQITKIILLNATKEDSNSGSILSFLQVSQNHVFQGFSSYILEEFFNKTEIIACNNLVKVFLEIEDDSNKISDKVAVDIPLSEPISETIPGYNTGLVVRGETIADTWVKILYNIKMAGVKRPTQYDGQCQEILNLVSVVSNEPEDFYIPDYLPTNREFINNYIQDFLYPPESKKGVKYNYGERLRTYFGKDQIQQVIDKLISEKDAASGVMSLWDVKDHEHGCSPCLNHIWVRIQDDKLSLTALFRSNDMYSAWCSNALALRALQQLFYKSLVYTYPNLVLGDLITISQSAHIYDDCWEDADKIISEYYKYKPCYDDACGNFIIERENNIIKVFQTSKTGEVVKTFEGKNPLRLVRDIAQTNPNISPDHIGYLGIEIQKALLDGYMQDRLTKN